MSTASLFRNIEEVFYWKKSVCQIDDPACQQIEAETVLNFEHQPCLFVKFAKFVNFVKIEKVWKNADFLALQ